MNRDEAYIALSDLIYKGFLTLDVELDGKLFVFKTVNEREFDLIKLYIGKPDRSDYLLKFNIYYLIYSLFIVDGKNILLEREKYIEELYQLIFLLPSTLIKNIMQNLNNLRQLAYKSLKYLEGFCYTEQSRKIWKSLNGNSPASVDFTGILGSNNIGLNVHQDSWISINRELDIEAKNNHTFSLAIMIASASNPKGARSIRNQYESSLKNAEERRTKLAKDGFIDTKKWTPEGWAAPVNTAEELVAELERQVTGVKDRHDKLIEKYVENLKNEANKRVEEAKLNINKTENNSDNVFIDGSQRILTPEESKGLLTKKPLYIQKVKNEDSVEQEDQDRFIKKIGKTILTNNK